MASLTVSHALRTGRIVEVYATGDRHEPAAVIERPDVWSRPPLGPPLAGRRSTAGGRGHRRSQSREARERRRELCMRAVALRSSGLSIRDVAERIGVSRSTAGSWLRGVYPLGVVTNPYPRRGAGLPRGRAPAFSDGRAVERFEVPYDPAASRWPRDQAEARTRCYPTHDMEG